jgi:UDP-N-acetylmuramoyl-L-alanine---L-glutamate ligase
VKIADIANQSVLILGLGVEGRSTLRFLRARFPEKPFGIADAQPLEKLPAELRDELATGARTRLHLGPEYLSALKQYDLIVKSPGIPVNLPEYKEALAAGKQFTSQTALFFANCPGTIIGITGTKGKSTTASLTYAIVQTSYPDAQLLSNIGVPPLDFIGNTVLGNREQQGNMEQRTGNRGDTERQSIFVYELSSHQLEGLHQSPHIAILLNIVPEHLDYYDSFEQYVDAKENITRFHTKSDWLIYDADHELPSRIASRSRASKLPCSRERSLTFGCYVAGEWIVYRSEQGSEARIVNTGDVPLPGRFNLINVAAACAAGIRAGVPLDNIADAIRQFRPLEHRLELVGTFGGITYYNDSIATVPEATIGALDTLGDRVATLLLGGADRGVDFSTLARRLTTSAVNTVILFPPSGQRIWQTVTEHCNGTLPQHFFADSMEEAVRLAKEHTPSGKICLHSPSSPSFGLFRDYRDRGEQFKKLVSR